MSGCCTQFVPTPAGAASGGGGGGGGSGSPQRFQYIVTGLEPDLSNLIIALPVARASATYFVFPAQSDDTFDTSFKVLRASRTTAQFVLTLGAPAAVGDVFWFNVVDPT